MTLLGLPPAIKSPVSQRGGLPGAGGPAYCGGDSSLRHPGIIAGQPETAPGKARP